MIVPIKELANGQFYEKVHSKSLLDKFYLKISPAYSLPVRFYIKRSEFVISKDRARVDERDLAYPLTILRGKAYRSNICGSVQYVARGDADG